jgi:uncharacterized protein (TIGR03067 family)
MDGNSKAQVRETSGQPGSRGFRQTQRGSRMRFLTVSLTLLCIALAANAVPAPAEKKTPENLDGTWVCTAADRGDVKGPDLVGKLKFTFAGDKMTLDSPNGKVESKVTLDFAKRPGWLDFEAKLPKANEVKVERGLGLFLRDGDTLKICLDNRPGSPRPIEFKAGGTIVVVTLQLQK